MLSERIDKLDKTIAALSESHDNHISYLGNFARHDVKNSIQSMDSVLSTNSLEEINDDHLKSLKTNLQVIRETMDNFSKLVPYSQDKKFALVSLISAVELLNRNTFFSEKITFIKDFDKSNKGKINLPFHSILQMLNNLIINALKSIEGQNDKKIIIEAEVTDKLTIKISDTGVPIDKDKISKIFEFGYSTTGGSGIGLYHARYLCELFNGSIDLINTSETGYTKSFLLNLPLSIDS